MKSGERGRIIRGCIKFSNSTSAIAAPSAALSSSRFAGPLYYRCQLRYFPNKQYIDKGEGKQRPLGIPTVRDRVVQMAAKIIIEPIFEADFEESSYGFRPKRSATEALEAIRRAGNQGNDFVVDADIKGYFDSIDQEKLMVLVGERISDSGVSSAMQGHGSKFSRKREEAIQALCAQPNVEEAARAAGISKQTLIRWLKLPEFLEAYRAARREAVAQSNARLQQASSVAVTNAAEDLIDANAPPAVRVRAAKHVLSGAQQAIQLEDIQMRLDEVERTMERASIRRRG